MTARERMLKALSHEEPDRVPIDLGGMTTCIEALAYKDLVAYLDLEIKELRSFVRDHILEFSKKSFL